MQKPLPVLLDSGSSDRQLKVLCGGLRIPLVTHLLSVENPSTNLFIHLIWLIDVSVGASALFDSLCLVLLSVRNFANRRYSNSDHLLLLLSSNSTHFKHMHSVLSHSFIHGSITRFMHEKRRAVLMRKVTERQTALEEQQLDHSGLLY